MREEISKYVLAVLVMVLSLTSVNLAARVTDLSEQRALIATDTPIPTPTPATLLPYLASLSPDYGPVGTVVTVRGTYLWLVNQTVIVNYMEVPATIASDSQSLTFVMPSSLYYPCTGTNPCPTNSGTPVMPGQYSIQVKSAAGKSNVLTFLVTSNDPISKIVKLKSLKPTSGAVNTKVTITGSGFTKKNNMVVFNYHEIPGIASKTGTTLTFVVPPYLYFPCTGTDPCPTNNVKPTTPGTYAVKVRNSKGTSNTLTFTVL